MMWEATEECVGFGMEFLASVHEGRRDNLVAVSQDNQGPMAFRRIPHASRRACHELAVDVGRFRTSVFIAAYAGVVLITVLPAPYWLRAGIIILAIFDWV